MSLEAWRYVIATADPYDLLLIGAACGVVVGMLFGLLCDWLAERFA